MPFSRFRLLFVLFLAPFLSSGADHIQKGMERLGVHDYFTAREHFLRSIRKNPAPAWYGLSKISQRSNNPFYNLDSARIFILRSDTAFSALPPKNREKLKTKYGLDSLAIAVQMDSVAERAYAVAAEHSTVDSWNRYLADYRWSRHEPEAAAQRNKLAYGQARAQNSSSAYLAFIATYPDAAQVHEARQHADERLYAELTADQNAQSYDIFIRTYPQSAYRSRAEDSLFTRLTSHHTVEEYHAFALNYPGNRNTPDAWMKMYHRFLELHGAGSYPQFISAFPDFPFPGRAADDYALYNTLFLPYREGGQWGYINDAGQVAIPAAYGEADRFSEGLAAVSREGQFGYINKKGRVEIPFRYDEAESFDNHLALVHTDGKATLINHDGDPLFPALHEDIGTPHEDRVSFLEEDRYGYMDVKGITVIRAAYATAGDFRNGVAVAGTEEGTGVIDRSGNWILAPEYTYIEMEDNGLLRVIRDGKFGLYNRFGEALLPPEYDAIGRFSEGLAFAARNGKAGYVNDSAEIVIPFSYDFNSETFSLSEFRRGYAVVSLRKKYGLIDTLGNRILPMAYDDLRFGSDTLPVAVRKKGRWSYVTMENKPLIELRFEDALAFGTDGAVAKLKGHYGMLDSAGKTTVPFIWDQVTPLGTGIVAVRKGTKTGLAEAGSGRLLEPAYDGYTRMSPDIIRLDREGRFGYFNCTRFEWLWREEGF